MWNKKEHFAPFPRFHWNHYIGFLTFLTVSKIVTSTQKTGEPSENIKFSLVSKFCFCFLHVHPFFVIYPLEGQMRFWGFFTFWAILAYCVAWQETRYIVMTLFSSVSVLQFFFILLDVKSGGAAINFLFFQSRFLAAGFHIKICISIY